MPNHRPRMVVLTHMVPVRNADNAGQNFVTAQVEHWSRTHDVECLVIPGRSAQTQLKDSIVPSRVIPAAPLSLLKRFTKRLGNRILRSFPSVPNPDLFYDIWHDDVSRRALVEADVIVLQWSREAGLAGFLRKRCPHATIVAVVHDVESQAVDRRLKQARGLRDQTKFRLQRMAAHLAERAVMHKAHKVMVLSIKDARLLPKGNAEIVVVPPPITAPESPIRKPEPGRILFVAGARPENEEALRWLLREVIPCTAGRVSSSQIYVVGRQTPAAVAEFQAAGVKMLGFVEDLSAEYARAAIAVVPLRLGAGVKFKTAEAILHRVPLVTTSVGAEGITGLEGTGRVTDSPESFADRLNQFLASPADAQSDADELYRLVHDAMSPQTFAANLDKVLTAPQ